MRTIRHLVGCLLVIGCLLAPSAAASGVDVVPGVAFRGPDGSITFTGAGFAPRSEIQLTLNGLPQSTVRATRTGALDVKLHLSGAGDQSLAAAGHRPDGGTHVVTATIHIGPVVPLLPREAKLANEGPGRVYRALLAGLGLVVVAVGVHLTIRLVSRRRSAP